MLYGIISHTRNDFYLLIGTVATVSLPFIGVFDDVDYRPIHLTIAGIFFGSTGIYMALISNALYKNRDKFPESKQRAICMTHTATKGIYLVLGVTLFFMYLEGGLKGRAAICEWAMGIYYLNFLCFISFTNTYYETVHEKNEIN
jgi:hypothetical protein